MTTVYLASPLGFSPEMKDYRDRIKLRLKEWVVECSTRGIRPWTDYQRRRAITDWHDRVAALGKVARRHWPDERKSHSGY